MESGQLKASIATFSTVIRRKPGFAEGWNKRARRRAAAVPRIATRSKRNPYHFGALAGYGQIYFRLEQYQKAIDYGSARCEELEHARRRGSIKATEQLLRTTQEFGVKRGTTLSRRSPAARRCRTGVTEPPVRPPSPSE